jgi:hypothetical protein
MVRKKRYQPSQTAVEAHLAMMQAVIGRMASNSASCKSWCITLVSALLVVIMEKGRPEFLPIATIPILLFLALDGFYLIQEKLFRNSYDGFIAKLHRQELVSEDLYAIKPRGTWQSELMKALESFSIWPFYLAMLAFVLAAYLLITAPSHR